MHWRMIAAALPVAVIANALGAPLALCANSPPTVRNDARVQAAVEDARTSFLASQRFDRLDVTVLLAAKDGSWLRGSVGGESPWYPASCVKLGFAIAAVHHCESQGRAADCLDDSVLPMLRDSDNVATGVVVDAITGAPNGPVEGADYEAWFARRLYTENLLAKHGLLAGQKFINKTYPTNSGEEPAGLEALARERHGRNSMHADGAANLMLALVTGEFGEPAPITSGRGFAARSFRATAAWAAGFRTARCMRARSAMPTTRSPRSCTPSCRTGVASSSPRSRTVAIPTALTSRT